LVSSGLQRTPAGVSASRLGYEKDCASLNPVLKLNPRYLIGDEEEMSLVTRNVCAPNQLPNAVTQFKQ
jgi:hypothetical protein